jgi:nucleoside-diphosphate-sugar epimerase
MSDRRLLVTGACGCIGAWVVHELVGAGEDVVSFDLSTDRRRLALLLEPEELERIPHVAGDISDLDAVERALDGHGITNVIHLAALQVPFCRADPPLGARVNVVGTANVFEAVRRGRGRIGPVVYASSIAAYDAPDGEGPPSMSGQPGTLYGVYKRANESTAWLYRAESGVPSVGLRPHIVYGVGRDQGLTSTVTAAMLAAAAGTAYTIPYGGAAQFQLAADVARAFVEASRAGGVAADVHNLPGPRTSVSDVIAAIAEAVPGSAGSIDFEDVVLPFPEELDSSSFVRAFPGFAVTPLAEGVRSTTERFAALLGRGAPLAPAT